MEEFLIRYGLAAVALLSSVGGDVVFVLAGVVAHLGVWSLPAGVVAGACGALAGDCGWYALGRNRGEMIRRSPLYRRAGARVEDLSRRLGAWQLFAMRLLPGTRVATLVLWGVRREPVHRLLIFDGLGCLLWASALGALGYLLSTSAERMLGEIKRAEMWLVAGALAAAGCALLWRARARRRAEVDFGTDADEAQA